MRFSNCMESILMFTRSLNYGTWRGSMPPEFIQDYLNYSWRKFCIARKWYPWKYAWAQIWLMFLCGTEPFGWHLFVFVMDLNANCWDDRRLLRAFNICCFRLRILIWKQTSDSKWNVWWETTRNQCCHNSPTNNQLMPQRYLIHLGLVVTALGWSVCFFVYPSALANI